MGIQGGSIEERQELGPTGCIAIHKCAETDLMGNAGPCEPLGDDADDDSEHGGTSVESLSPFELFKVDITGCGGLEPLIAGLVGLHRHGSIETKCNAVLTFRHGAIFRYRLVAKRRPEVGSMQLSWVKAASVPQALVAPSSAHWAFAERTDQQA